MNQRSLPKHWAQAMAQSIVAHNKTTVTQTHTDANNGRTDQKINVAAQLNDTQSNIDAQQSSVAAQRPAVTAKQTAAAQQTSSVQPVATAHTQTQQPLVCAAGISPSGTVHIGNCREIFTVDFVVRYLRAHGVSALFYLFWDDYDALRKIPEGSTEWMTDQLRLPLSVATTQPDSLTSFAALHEQQFEQYLPIIGVQPHIKYQHHEYEAGTYTAMLQTALSNRKQIIAILNENRATPLPTHWWPIVVYSQHTNKDTTEILQWDGKYGITYRCTETDHTNTIDIRSYRKVKLKWRIDWPMRWALYRVAFEPAGKDHHSQGGSFDTAKKIAERVFGIQPPLSMQYDFISIKGKGGKISSSSGDTISIAEVLEIYQPEVVRYLFASTRANAEFSISFDVDVIKIYEDYDKCELIAHGLTEAGEKRIIKEQGIYWLSQIESNAQFGTGQSEYSAAHNAGNAQLATSLSTTHAHLSPPAIDDVKNAPTPNIDNSNATNDTTSHRSIPQISFRHLCTMVQIYDGNIDSALAHCPQFHSMSSQRKQQFHTRAQCALTWIQTYAPDRFKFTLKQPGDTVRQLTDDERILLEHLIAVLKQHDSTPIDTNGSGGSGNAPATSTAPSSPVNDIDHTSNSPSPAPDVDPSTALHNALYDLAKQLNIEFKQICQLCYQLLIGRDDGPRLASFMLLVGISHCQNIFAQYTSK